MSIFFLISDALTVAGLAWLLAVAGRCAFRDALKDAVRRVQRERA